MTGALPKSLQGRPSAGTNTLIAQAVPVLRENYRAVTGLGCQGASALKGLRQDKPALESGGRRRNSRRIESIG
jgi:hypothetical protein